MGCDDSGAKLEKSQSLTSLPISDTKIGADDARASGSQVVTAGEESVEFVYPDSTPDLSSRKNQNPNSTVELAEVFAERDTKAEELKIKPRIYDPNYTPLCTRLEINQGYWFTTMPNRGFMPCFYFDLPDNARANFVALGQQVGSRQVDIYINHDVPANGTFSFVGASTEVFDSDEVAVYAEAGHYYFFIDERLVDGGNILIGAEVNTIRDDWENIDSTPSYTGNDLEASATQIKNGSNPNIFGSIDSVNDVDHFILNSYWGQDLTLALKPLLHQTAETDLVVDVFIGGSWITVTNNEQHVLSGFAPYDQLLIRVRPQLTNVNIPAGGDIRYLLNAGSLVTEFEDITPDGDRAARVPPSHNGPWARVQNANNFTWKVKALDSTNNPIRDLQLNFRADNEFGAYAALTSGYTDYQGVATVTKVISDYCAPNAPNQYLNILYHAGRYNVKTTYYSDYSNIENQLFEPWLQLCTDY